MKDYLDLIKSPKILSFLVSVNISLIGFFVIIFFIIFLSSTLCNLLEINTLIFTGIKIKYWLILFLTFLWSLYFLYKYFFLQKNDLNINGEQTKVGIIIAIDDKNDLNGYLIKQDFLESLKENLDKSKFKIIELPIKYLKQIYKNKNNLDGDLIIKLNKKIKGHYFIGGQTQKIRNGGLKCYLQTNAMVFHKNIPSNVQSELYLDFNILYPKNIDFDNEWYKSGIDFSGEYSSIVARYIIGVAFLISNNPFGALELHKKLHLELEKIKKNDKVNHGFNEKYFNHIKEKIKVIQYEELRLIVNYFYKVKNTKEWEKYLLEWIELTDFYKFYSANLYSQRGIYEFLVNGNIIESRKFIKKSGSITTGDKSYKYSLVFLDLFDKKYRQAINRMKEILKKKQYNLELLTVEEVIDFMNGILEKYSDRLEFIYWQSLLYYKKLDNIPMAYSKICDYIKIRGTNNYEYEIYNPNNLKNELERKMNLL